IDHLEGELLARVSLPLLRGPGVSEQQGERRHRSEQPPRHLSHRHSPSSSKHRTKTVRCAPRADKATLPCRLFVLAAAPKLAKLARLHRRTLMRFEGTSAYVATDDLKVAVNAAITLERPLLVKGEPGTGKTVLALEIAKSLAAPLLEWHVKS